MDDKHPTELKITPGDIFPGILRDKDPDAPAQPADVIGSPAPGVDAKDLVPVAADPMDETQVGVPPTLSAPRAGGLQTTGAAHPPARVLHTRVVTGCGGGPEKTIFRSPRFADADRYHMAAAYLYPQADPGMCVIRETAKHLGCPLYEIAETRALDHQAVGALVELCKELKIDIWHGHDYKSNALGLLVKRFHPMKLVTTAHGFTRETWRTRLYYHVDNLAMLGYDQVIAVSPPLVKHCAYHGVNPDRLTYIPNAIDSAEYARSNNTQDAKRAVGLPPDRFAIGVIGRLSPEKGVDRAIAMMPHLLAEYPRVELHLIGDGPQRRELQALAGQLGVANAIRWWGWQSDARPIYEMLDTLLLPSRTEGLPNVVLEAMAMGVPVAATDVGGVSDLLDNGDCGIVLGNDEHTWARAIAPLLRMPTLRESYTDLAHRRVREAFSFQNRMRKVMDVYDRVLGRSATPNTNSVTPSTQTRLAA
jgi:glycosyltransferase involved in cell wall biosynthesis